MCSTDIISRQSLDVMLSEFISWLCCEPLSINFLFIDETSTALLLSEMKEPTVTSQSAWHKVGP